jgi:DNA-directed RNA polymerase
LGDKYGIELLCQLVLSKLYQTAQVSRLASVFDRKYCNIIVKEGVKQNEDQHKQRKREKYL